MKDQNGLIHKDWLRDVHQRLTGIPCPILLCLLIDIFQSNRDVVDSFQRSKFRHWFQFDFGKSFASLFVLEGMFAVWHEQIISQKAFSGIPLEILPNIKILWI
jgi:hypothetical protein